MASSHSLLSEDQFLCPICLDTFTQPVSTPCGHNFCRSCLTTYWNNESICQCPVCKERFERRPDLKVNTFISELASQFMLLQATDAPILSRDQANSGSAVLCDICTDNQQEAVKSCLECLTSYCNIHLEPHHRAAGLRRHTLVDPLARLEDRICKEHNQPLMLFCRNDEDVLCSLCAGLLHGSHVVIPVHQAYKEMKDHLGNTEAEVQHLIQEKQQKLQAMKKSVKQGKKEAKDAIANSVRDLTAVVSEIQTSQAELVKVIDRKQKAAEEQADGVVHSMEQELTGLHQTSMKLRELKQDEDHLRFLRNFPNPALLPHITDFSAFSFNRHLEIERIQRSLSSTMSQLRTLLGKMNSDIYKFSASNNAMLRHLQQYEVDVLLDPDTAHPLLILSNDQKQVRYSMGLGLWEIKNLNPNMFTEHLAVLGMQGFSSQNFYFEVLVSQKTEWCLGVATASVQRRGALTRGPDSGLWAIWFLENKFETFSAPGVTVYLGNVERVGVFADYDGGEISFYDVETAALIYSCTECYFTEELYPYLNPCDNEYGSNLGPLVIVPVSRAA